LGAGRDFFCQDNEAFNSYGGICGGSGYIVSRVALQQLLADGAPALHAVYDKTPWPNDMTTSCQLRRTGSDLVLADGMYGYPMDEISMYEGHFSSGNFITVHYVDSATMRWFYALNEGWPADEVKKLEEKAFHRGCVRAWELVAPSRFLDCMQRRHGAQAVEELLLHSKRLTD